MFFALHSQKKYKAYCSSNRNCHCVTRESAYFETGKYIVALHMFQKIQCFFEPLGIGYFVIITSYLCRYRCYTNKITYKLCQHAFNMVFCQLSIAV